MFGHRRFRRGVALQPLFLNDRLLFISLEKERECTPKNPKPMLSGLHGSHLPLLQIAVYSCCFVRLWWKHFSSARTEKVGCGSTSSQNWTEPSAHLPPRSLWLSDHLFAVICPLSHDAKKKSYFRSTKQKVIDTQKNKKKKDVWRIVLSSEGLLRLASAPWKAVMDSFLNSMVFIFAVFLLSVQTNSHVWNDCFQLAAIWQSVKKSI